MEELSNLLTDMGINNELKTHKFPDIVSKYHITIRPNEQTKIFSIIKGPASFDLFETFDGNDCERYETPEETLKAIIAT